jgi:spore coat polysaccharide biosynthesis predicted glycosyltransferase SpsG
MDQYANRLKINRKTSKNNKRVIGIGTSGFNNIDLISHTAIEFDFIYEVLSTLQEIKNENEIFKIKIKVRPNCFINQYNLFVEEYFNDLDIEIVKEVSMITFLENIDLYISIYSQTLFEASCLKIPSIYYKIDDEYLDKPFDEKSELVTVKNIKELKKAYYDFKNTDDRYNDFMKQEIMEKYIGPLDGKNTERNLKYIYSLLNIKE